MIPGAEIDGRGPGDMANFRCGDSESGRWSEGCDFLPFGLWTLEPPAPTEAPNLDRLDVGDFKLTELLLPSFKPLAALGVGVLGDEPEGLRRALATGTKMPAPETLVEK